MVTLILLMILQLDQMLWLSQSFNESGVTIGGVPAKKISDNNSHSNLNKCLGLDK